MHPPVPVILLACRPRWARLPFADGACMRLWPLCPPQAKEKDKQELLAMCNDLMARLEREGIAV